MENQLKDIRLNKLKEVFNRAKFSRQTNISEKTIKKIEEDDYLPREDTQAKIVDTVNTLRKRQEPYTTKDIFGDHEN